MGTTINGATGIMNTQSVMVGTLTIKNTNNPQVRMSALCRIDSKTKTKKQLNYNHKEISGQLLRAKKAQNAANVLTRAKSKLATLQRQAGTGQYDTKEIANALAHARRMVRCAQLKVRNLREEEQGQKAHKRESGAHEQQKQNEVKRRVAQKEREIKSKVAREELQEVTKEKRKRSELVQKRRMHRNQEQSRINEADMKYIKGLTENNGGVGSSSNAGCSAVLDLSMEAAAMAEVQMLAQVQQEIEAEVEAEIAADIAAETALGDAGAAVGSGMASGNSTDAGAANTAVGGAVDVSI